MTNSPNFQLSLNITSLLLKSIFDRYRILGPYFFLPEHSVTFLCFTTSIISSRSLLLILLKISSTCLDSLLLLLFFKLLGFDSLVIIYVSVYVSLNLFEFTELFGHVYTHLSPLWILGYTTYISCAMFKSR